MLFTRPSPWSYYTPMFGVFINLGLLYWKRHQHPLNLLLLSTFTLLEAFTLGILCAYFDNTVVIQALYVKSFPSPCLNLDIVMQVDYLGGFLGPDYFHFSIQGMSSAIPYPSPPDNIQYDFSGLGPWLFGGLIALCRHLLLFLKPSTHKLSHCCRHDRNCWNIHPLLTHNRPPVCNWRNDFIQRVHCLRHVLDQQSTFPG